MGALTAAYVDDDIDRVGVLSCVGGMWYMAYLRAAYGLGRVCCHDTTISSS